MNILVISQHIFPMQSPRAHRTTELIKEFSRQKHKVTVYAVLGQYNYKPFEKKYGIKVKQIPLKWQLTPYTSDGPGTRSFIDKILGKLFGKIAEFPDIEFMYQIPKAIKKEKNIDILISIANPHPIHWGCAKSKAQNPQDFPNKWIADCGDPFMKADKNSVHPTWFSYFEKKFSRAANFISVPVKNAKDFYYESFNEKIVVIPQGFKFNTPKKLKFTSINSVPTFAYSGTFIEDIRNPELLFKYLLSLSVEFKFIIYTSHSNLIDQYRLKLGSKLVILKPIPREQLLVELSKMDFLINLENINSPGQVPSKLIDYSIVNRPILSTSPNIDKNKFNCFMNSDYTLNFQVQNIEQYKIENVVKQFLIL